jgi:hypothetical protein
MLASCSELQKQGKLRFAEGMDSYIREHKGKVKQPDIAACMGKRSDLPKSGLVGEPSYTVNAFLTCIANRTTNSGGLLMGGDFMVYEVSTVFSQPAPPTQIKRTEAKIICRFEIADKEIKSHPPVPRDELFGSRLIPEKIIANHPCLDMPDAYQHVSLGERVR